MLIPLVRVVIVALFFFAPFLLVWGHTVAFLFVLFFSFCRLLLRFRDSTIALAGGDWAFLRSRAGFRVLVFIS